MNLKKLICKFMYHNYQPLVEETGLQIHRCTRCGDEEEFYLMMPGERGKATAELKNKIEKK